MTSFTCPEAESIIMSYELQDMSIKYPLQILQQTQTIMQQAEKKCKLIFFCME